MTDRELIDELDRQLEYEELHAPLEAAIMAMRNRLANPPTALASRPDGWRGIESIPVKTRVLVWVNEPNNRMVGTYFGSAYGLSDGKKIAKPEGGNGSGWNITHWMPLPPAPQPDE